MVENYMQALLHAALLLGDPQRCGSVCGITVSAVYEHSGGRLTYPGVESLWNPRNAKHHTRRKQKGNILFFIRCAFHPPDLFANLIFAILPIFFRAGNLAWRSKPYGSVSPDNKPSESLAFKPCGFAIGFPGGRQCCLPCLLRVFPVFDKIFLPSTANAPGKLPGAFLV